VLFLVLLQSLVAATITHSNGSVGEDATPLITVFIDDQHGFNSSGDYWWQYCCAYRLSGVIRVQFMIVQELPAAVL
jgi:hypothetical protein